ncbi:MAG: Ig-like domain-containing protein [Propionibacteriaceae bacterium]
MQTKRPILTLTGLAGVVLLATTLAGCGSVPAKGSDGASQQPSAASSTQATKPAEEEQTPDAPPAPAPVVLTPSVKDAAKDVTVDTIVSVKATAGTLTKVKLWTKGKDSSGDTKTITVDGKINADGTSWTAAEALDPGSKYRVEMEGKNASNQAVTETKTTFNTEKLTLDQQTYPTIQPAKGSKVGIGMPVILTFDVPVKDKAEFQKHLKVTSTGDQVGTWSWFNSQTVHFRPKEYWKPGTKVKVTANLNGVKAGNGIYGQKSVSTSFTVGRSFITKVNLNTHYAKVYRSGKLVKTIPITGGKAGWRTRSGTKLIMAKEYNKVMTNEAIGAKEDYRLTAKYALRITNSGEFLHSAPWSMGNLGVRNASHGCTGMSIANSGWLYERTLIGDPVITTGSNRGIEQGNGWSDWDISYKQFKKGSAL